MVDFDRVRIDDSKLKHNDKCLMVDSHNTYDDETYEMFIIVIKIVDDKDIYIQYEEGKNLYKYNCDKHIIIKILEEK